MGRFDATKATIDANIKSNGNQEITGDILNSVMKGMVDATDAELTELSERIGKEDSYIIPNAYISYDNIGEAPGWTTIVKKVKGGQTATLSSPTDDSVRYCLYTAAPSVGNNASILASDMVTGSMTATIPNDREYYYIGFAVGASVTDIKIVAEGYTTGLVGEIATLSSKVSELDAKATPTQNMWGVLAEKCPKFYEAFLSKREDVTICVSGTSLTQGNIYTSVRADANERPPLMHGYDLCSLLWDKLSPYWQGQQYRRYDHPSIGYSGSFSEGCAMYSLKVNGKASNSGTIKVIFNYSEYRTYEVAVTASMTTSQICEAVAEAIRKADIGFITSVHSDGDKVNFGGTLLLSAMTFDANGSGVSAEVIKVWDDSADIKNGVCRTTYDANANVNFVIPKGNRRFNFIYRTDLDGADVTIYLESANKMQVWDGSAWVEANGYTFSTRESAATSTKGNTCYQKRIKMRVLEDAVGVNKVVVFQKGNNADRLNFVGFEFSPRTTMLTLVNSARGGHCWGYAEAIGIPSYNDLSNTQDSDIWEFNPTLLLAEVTCINWAAGSERGIAYDPMWFVNLAKRKYYNGFNDDATSLAAKSNGCEMVFYGDTLSVSGTNAKIWDEEGNLVWGVVTSNATNGDGATDNVGLAKTALDNYTSVDGYMKSQDMLFIPITQQFVAVAKSMYGNYIAAMTQSGADGDTLSTDDTHLNDKGAALWASFILPLFENL